MTEWSLRSWLRGDKFKPQQVTKAYYYAKITRLAMNEFVYKSEDLHNPECIEKYLWLDGRVMIWFSDVLGWIVTRCNETAWDINGFAIRWKPIPEYQDIPIDLPEMGLEDKCVVIYDIPSRMFMGAICCKWIDEIADTNETIRTQIFNQKTPLIAVAKTPKERNKLQNAIVNIANNVRALILDSPIKDSIDALNIEAPFNISDLQAHLKTKEAEMLEFLGIDSQSAFQKKERLITDEQESNNQTLSYLISDRFNSRKDGIKKLNEKGLTITVSLNNVVDINDVETDTDGELNNDDKSN